MKDFIFNYWQIIVFAAISILEIIILFCKKGIKVDTIKEEILRLLPFGIAIAEQMFGSGNGSKKLDFVLDYIKSILKLDSSEDEFIIRSIEAILATPAKKLEKGNFDEK